MTEDLSGMTAVILCGGLGTRLREETEFKPKPMVEVGGRPILWHIMKIYNHFGVRDFVLTLGYKGDIIRDYFLNYPYRNSNIAIDFQSGEIETLGAFASENWRVTMVETGHNTMTGSRIKHALPYIKSNTFFVTYGDGVADVNIPAVLAAHRKHGKMGTMTAVRPSSRYGEIEMQNGLVQSFNEKPQVGHGWINGGFLAFEKKAFDRVTDMSGTVLETAVMESLSREGQLGVYQHEGFWQCMDTYREMEMLNGYWAKGNAPWQLWKNPDLKF